MNDAATDDQAINALLDQAHIPTTVKTAAAALALTGLAAAMLGLQNLTLVQWAGAFVVGPIALLGFGAASIAVAAKLMHARSWSLAAALASSALLSLGCLGFLVLSVLSGVFSSIAVLAAAGAITALVLTLIAAGPFAGLMATRARLRDAGYDLDL